MPSGTPPSIVAKGPTVTRFLDRHRNIVVNNFRGRLLNDIIVSMITTSYEKSKINSLFREHVRSHLTPTEAERNFVSAAYESVQDVLGANSLLTDRFLSTLHDPSQALERLERQLRASFENPTAYTFTIARQTHSITISFIDTDDHEVFAVDMVPAYVLGENSFGEDQYLVPELLAKSHAARRRLNEEVRKGKHQMAWIKSDPRGYIKVASQVNEANSDFRRTTKFVKGWRASCKQLNDKFPLKAFHIEQVITGYFKAAPGLDTYDAVFKFFCELPSRITQSSIPDRADPTKNIDAYVDSLSEDERILVRQTRDYFLINLEQIKKGDDVGELLSAGLHAPKTEAYLFDQCIPVLTDANLLIYGRALQRQGSFSERILDAVGKIEIDRKIEFRINGHAPTVDLFKWKVKNDDSSPERRGEITDHRTRNDPEHTKYNGVHYVECYAIRSGVCIARARQDVRLRS
jgi:adenylyl/guanylyl cyclase-like protein with sensor domain